MHPSWLSFAVKLTAFFGDFFFAVEKKLLAVGPPPTLLTLKLKKQKQKTRIKRYCYSLKITPIPLGDNLSGTAGQKTLRDAPVVVKLRR